MRKIISLIVGVCMAFAVLLPVHLGVKEANADDASINASSSVEEAIVDVQGDNNGQVASKYDEDGNLVLTFVPNKNCVFQSVIINGVDMTAEVVANKLVIKNPEGTIKGKATFVEKQQYYFTYENIGEYCAEFVNKQTSCYEGEVLQVSIQLEAGYELLSVKFNGEEMSYNEETGCYEVVPTASGHVTVSVKEPVDEVIGETIEEESSQSATVEGGLLGCGSSLGLGSVALLGLMGAAFVALKKKN